MSGTDILIRIEGDTVSDRIASCPTRCNDGGQDDRPECTLCGDCEALLERYHRPSRPTSGREHWEVDAPPLHRLEGWGI